MPRRQWTWMHTIFAPFKRFLPGFMWKTIRRTVTAFYTPLVFAFKDGHFRSSLFLSSVDGKGRPIPWYTYPSIDFLKYRDFKERTVLEFGCGQSTIWWAERCKSVFGFEEEADWMKVLQQQVPDNVELSYFPKCKDAYDAVEGMRKVLAGRKFDIVVIDGMYRHVLVPLALESIKEGGALVIDNSEHKDMHPALKEYNDWIRIDFHGYAPGVVLPHCTSIMCKPNCFLLSNSDYEIADSATMAA